MKDQLKWENPFLIAIFLTVMYYISLLPISGFLGGIYFFFVGWIIPDILIFLVSYGIAKSVSKKIIIRIPIVIFTSLLLLFLVNANQLVKYINTKSINTGYEVTQSIAVSQDSGVSFNTSSGPSIHNAYPNPLATHFILGSDEGCMCMYFKRNSEKTYFATLSKQISNHLGKPLGYSLSRDENSLFMISLKKSDEDKSTYDLLFEIKKDTKVMSRFWQKGIPETVAQKQKYLRDDRLKKNFFKNTTELLLRKSFLSSIVSDALSLSYFPSKEFEEFLSRAVIEP
ncbi:MAG: hypothetical protein JKY22_00230 [Flavobacteriaceae bacterium]|nr:hypothetical protein [Flavobacteriaceae bacterium]